jgi:hypothetical protein
MRSDVSAVGCLPFFAGGAMMLPHRLFGGAHTP